MSISGITTSIISQLGNSSGSIAPVIAKDTATSLSLTLIHSKSGSKRDGKEKAIEKFGTAAIWLGGIPFLKKVFDLTAYKIAKINPDFDVRKLNPKNADNIDVMMKKVGENSKYFADLKRIKEHPVLTKGLFISKFVIATATTLVALGGLIGYKQRKTEEDIKKRIFEQMAAENNIYKNKINEGMKNNNTFGAFNKTEQAAPVAFKGAAGAMLSEFMFNPLYNMSLLDVGIFAKRVKQGRKGEKGEIAFDEAMNIAFYYPLAKQIQKGLEAAGVKASGRPIDLDYRILSDGGFKEAIKSGALKESIEKFNSLKEHDSKIIDHIFDKGNDTLVSLLKRTGEIPADKKTGEIIATKLIEPEGIKNTVKKLENIIETQAKSGVDLDKFLGQARKLKAGTIFANIGIAILFLGVLQPLIIIATRKLRNNGKSDNLAIEKVEADLKKQYLS